MAATRNKATQAPTPARTNPRTAMVKKAAAKASSVPAASAVPASASAPHVVALVPAAKGSPPTKKAPVSPSVTAVVADKAQAARLAVRPVANSQSGAAAPAAGPAPRLEFEVGDFVVYPVHGVGKVERVETIAIAGFSVTTYVITFEKERMTLKVPVSKAKASGLRKLSSRDRIKSAMETLTGKAQIRRVMWSRRAQEYEAKINSGDPVSLAEVVRDLHRASDQPEQSYSERQIYQAAIERLAREVAAIEKIDEVKATAKLESVLAKAA